jgi:hypothetical protein
MAYVSGAFLGQPKNEQRERDLATLRRIVRGPGNYATPPADRIERLVSQGLVRKVRGVLRPTLKGRFAARFGR